MILLGFLLFPYIVQAKDSFQGEVRDWVSLATTINKNVDAGNYLVARQQLDRLAAMFSQSNLADKKLSVRAVQALSTVIIDLEERLNRITPNPEELKFYARRLLVTFDAVGHTYQPLWKTYYPVLKKDTGRILVHLRKHQTVQNELQVLLDNYLLIRPALIVVKSPTTVQKVDSLFVVLERDQDQKHQLEAVKHINLLLYPLFFGSEQDVLAVINPIGKVPVSTFLTIISIIIIGILGFVAWRKRNEMISSH